MIWRRGATLFADACPVSEEDWYTQYLDAIISARLVNGVDEVISRINCHFSHHIEAVIAQDLQVVEKFFSHIDSAILIHDASTQFADGGKFGIATGRLHARGPIGVEQLALFEYRVCGNGQIRP